MFIDLTGDKLFGMGFLDVGRIEVGLSRGWGMLEIPRFGTLDIRDVERRSYEPKFFVFVG